MEMQAMLEKMKIEKEKTEDLLKEKDEILRKKEHELETKDVELKVELKKLQKMKEFKPNMTSAFSQSLAQTEEEKKGKKKKKDCAETKRPSTPCVNQDADFKETSNILGAKWKTLSAEEKKQYDTRRNAMELLNQYLHFVQEAEQDNTKKAKKIKDPLKPKHPIYAYLIYANERRAALKEQNKSVIEVAKITGEEWKNERLPTKRWQRRTSSKKWKDTKGQRKKKP